MNSLIFFNLFANATFSFWMGVIVVAGFTWLFRINAGPWKLFIYTLPFVKVLVDFTSGVPSSSILLNPADPFRPGGRSFSLGLGADKWGPNLDLAFSVKDAHGNHVPASIGDFFYFWLNDIHNQLPQFILFLVVMVSFILIGKRLYKAIQFERSRRFDRQHAQSLMTMKSDLRVVDIYISQAFSGTPFTGGVFKPYICIPEMTHKQLSHDELSAVIAHEIGHVRQFDIVFTVLIQFIGDLFWFIPGYTRYSRKIDRMREIVADQFALKAGVRGEYLASALLKLKESTQQATDKFILYSAFAREQSLLKIRVLNLLGESTEKRQRFGWGNLGVRLLISFFIVGCVFKSTLGGNYANRVIVQKMTLKEYLLQILYK